MSYETRGEGKYLQNLTTECEGKCKKDTSRFWEIKYIWKKNCLKCDSHKTTIVFTPEIRR